MNLRRLSLVALAVALVGCKSSSSNPADSGAGSADSGPVPAGDGGGTDAGPALDYDFSAVDAEEFAGQWATDGLLIMVNGQVVHEKYGSTWTATMPHILYSATKSIGSALVGLAVRDGLMKVTDSVCTYVTDMQDGGTNLCSVTIQDLLQMGSGIQWAEVDNASDPAASNVLQMLYGDQTSMGGYTASLPRAAPTGTVFNYSSGDSDLLALAFTGALKGQDPRKYVQTNLFTPLGITNFTFEEDRGGSLIFSTDCFLTLRDFGKFGQMYLDNGAYNGAQVVPASWVTYSITPASTVATAASRVLDAGAAPGGSYGAGWWLNSTSPTATNDTWEYPHEPVDGYNAEGHYGQKLMIVPSLHLVVARTGSDIENDDAGNPITYVPDAMIGLVVTAIQNASDGGTH